MSTVHGRILVIDIGTTGTRAAIVGADASVSNVAYRRTPPDTPFPGLVEFDPVALAAAAIESAAQVLATAGPVDAVGISTQRASTVVWDRATGIPVGPGLGWQDLRTVGECISAGSEHGLAIAPNQTATKAAWLLAQHDPDRRRDLCIGTIDSWLVWNLTDGVAHVTDRSNAAVSGLLRIDGTDWDDHVLEVFGIDRRSLPRVMDSSGPLAAATALPGAPLIAGLAVNLWLQCVAWSAIALALAAPARRRGAAAGIGGVLASSLGLLVALEVGLPRVLVVAAVVYCNGVKVADIDVDSAGEWAKRPGHVVWIGLYEPDMALLERIREQFSLHPLAIEDAAKADGLFTLLMGDDVPPRKTFIMTHALTATLDV